MGDFSPDELSPEEAAMHVQGEGRRERWSSGPRQHGYSRDTSRDSESITWESPGPHSGRGPQGYRRSDERIHEEVCDRLTAHGPTGRFSLVDHPADRYLFLSAGSGATPMMSMARWLFDTAPQTDVTYVHFARRPEDLLFRSELGYMAEAAAGLRLRFAVTGAPEGEGWSSGRLDPALLSVMCPDIANRTVFCCGPDRFMDAARRLAGDLGVPAARWHEESFGATPAPVPVVSPIAPSATETAAAAGMQVVFTRSGRKAPLRPGQTILEAAEGCGLRIPTACRQGLCGTCLVRKLSGSVRMEHNGGIADDEIADGWILACCSEAESALVEVEV